MSFVDKYAEMHGASKKEAKEAIAKMVDTIEAMLKEGDKAQISHFGTFKVIARAERQGHNPATGETMMIPAKKVVKFNAAPDFKEKLK